MMKEMTGNDQGKCLLCVWRISSQQLGVKDDEIERLLLVLMANVYKMTHDRRSIVFQHVNANVNK